jgi:DNA-directed RNA polymerase subunit RPC12/RpoP
MRSFTGIASIVIILAAGIWILYYQSSKPEKGAPVAQNMPVVCDACGKSWATKTATLPIECKFCGKDQGWRGLQCADCGKVFPWVGWTPREPKQDQPVCKYCQSPNVTEYVDPDSLDDTSELTTDTP